MSLFYTIYFSFAICRAKYRIHPTHVYTCKHMYIHISLVVGYGSRQLLDVLLSIVTFMTTFDKKRRFLANPFEYIDVVISSTKRNNVVVDSFELRLGPGDHLGEVSIRQKSTHFDPMSSLCMIHAKEREK